METKLAGLSVGSLFNRTVTAVALGIYALMILTVGLQISARWILEPLFDMSLPWTVNLAQYLLVWMTFVGAAVASRKREHISLDLLVSRLSDRTLRILASIRTLAILGFIAVLIKGAYPLYVANRTTSIGTLPNTAPFTGGWLYIAALTGGCLIIVYGLRDFAQLLFTPETILNDLQRETNDDN
ncbi:TRAP transporter small permease [Halobacterium sp. KA-6]|uniref:TRAP transporter small permease n=1 Tax=Halobacterium sp. KA-6 TaxID=2896368 RepID=UPI001E41AA35|nr:TRAP transporter small permease [Halobacterium sp. KA-6]MCD2203663.1 TRAP transporter small permease [Halobacterium sp. KA-6]